MIHAPGKIGSEFFHRLRAAELCEASGERQRERGEDMGARVLAVAEAEIGYLEKANNKNLDSKTANAGNANYTKYARDLDRIAGWYNGPKQGYDWCAVFVEWCFIQAYGVEAARKILPHSLYSAGCTQALAMYRLRGRFYSLPKPGDQIFFTNSRGLIGHTGIVADVKNSVVTTIEGNTSSAAGVVANGGCVRKKTYQLTYNRIAGYGRPDWNAVPPAEKEDEDVFTYDEFKAFMARYEKEQRERTADSYAQASCKKAVTSGIFGDGNGDGSLDYPQAPLKRQEFATVLDRMNLLK